MTNKERSYDKFALMVEQQNKLNDLICPNWRVKLSLFDVYNAIFTEIAEFVETQEWKWWKKSTTDFTKARMELVDVFHFLITFVVIAEVYRTEEHYKNKVVIDLFTNAFMDTSSTKNSKYKLYSLSSFLLEYVTALVSVENYEKDIIVSSEHSLDIKFLVSSLESFFEVIHSFFNNVEDFTETFLIKNILNEVRSELGYAKGNYVRQIYDKDDNERAINMCAHGAIDIFNFAECKKEIKQKFYKQYIKWNP